MRCWEMGFQPQEGCAMEVDYRIKNCEVYGYAEPWEQEPFLRCSVCGGAINAGEDYYEFYDDPVCCACEFDYVLRHFHRYG